MNPNAALSPGEITQHLRQFSRWQCITLPNDAASLQCSVALASYARGLAMVAWLGQWAEDHQHHPDLTLTYSALSITWTTHDAGGVTQRDIDAILAFETQWGE